MVGVHLHRARPACQPHRPWVAGTYIDKVLNKGRSHVTSAKVDTYPSAMPLQGVIETDERTHGPAA